MAFPDRIRTHRSVEPVAFVRARLPARLQELFDRTAVLAGVNPVFAGLHPFAATEDGWSYGSVAHVAYPSHQTGLNTDRRRPTIVLPTDKEPTIVAHEFGHVVHHFVGLEYRAVPLTRYAKTNKREAFAEAFAAWLMPDSEYSWVHEDLLVKDLRTVAPFDRLALGE